MNLVLQTKPYLTPPKLTLAPSLEQPKERTLRPYQELLKKQVYQHYREGRKSVLVIAGGGLGKAQPLTSKILTPGGFKLMGEIAVGDLVSSADGGFSRVTGIFPQGVKEVFRIHFSDGSSTLCCDDHLWNVQSYGMTRKGGSDAWETMSLSEVRETYIRHRKISDRIPSGMEMRYRIPLVKPVEFFPVREPLPVDPYALGLLLGDGGLTDGIVFSCPDVQLQEALKELLPKPCHLKETGWNGGIDFRINGERQYNPSLIAIRSMGLGGCRSEDKFVPEMYKFASIGDRLAILQGLFDTDGFAAGSSCVEYVTTSQMLADDVKFLVNSLGGTVSISQKEPKFTYKGEQKIGQLAYRIIVKLPESFDPFRLKRKLEKYKKTSQSRFKPRRMIVGIEREGVMECQCISVDSPDHLYVTDDFIVTHNTTLAAWIMRDRSIRAKNPARSIFLVERNCLLEQTANTLKALGVDCSIIQGSKKVKWDHKCMVASLQTLRSWHDGGKDLHKMLGKVGMFVLDEAHDGVGQAIYQTLFDLYSADDKCVFLGLDASPWRMNKEEYLGRWFEASVESLQPPEAIKEGWLCPSRNFSRDGVLDMSKIGIQSDGDYNENQMAKQAMRPEALQLVVDEYRRLADGLTAICFCSTVAQSKAQSEVFNANGIPSEWQSGGTPDGKKSLYDREIEACSPVTRTRYANDAGLRDGRLKVVCSVGTHTKGYDCPQIACVIFVRAAKSKALFFQAAWRGCRTFPGKDYFVLLDFGGNLEVHGNPMGYHDYDISAPKPKRRSDDPVNMIKDCPECGAEISIFAKVCKCGHEFGNGNDDEQQVIFDPSLYMLKEWFDPIGCEQVQFLRTEKRRCYNNNENPDNAVKAFQKKFGFIPPNDWHQWAVMGKRASKASREQFKKYLEGHAPHDFWIKIQMRLEMGDNTQSPPQFLAKWNHPWWDVLGVLKVDSKAVVKAAYLGLAKQWHPDTCNDRENAETQMKILNKAWEEYQNEQH